MRRLIEREKGRPHSVDEKPKKENAMKTTDYPQLLITKRLVAPFGNTEGVLRSIQNEPDGDCISKEFFRHGSFVMAISSMEVSLKESLRYFLRWFPQKLPGNIFGFEKDVFFENHYTLLMAAIDRHIEELSYKSFEDFWKRYTDCLSIEWNDMEAVDSFKEIRASRNLLLHNSLSVNNQYLSSAGSKARGTKGNKLKIDVNYFRRSMEYIEKIKTGIVSLIKTKYGDYTVVNANKKLWDFMFKSPVMPYDDFWAYDVEQDRILAVKTGKHENDLSSTESIGLALWRTQFNEQGGDFLQHFNMHRFDAENQEKILFFLSIADNFSFEM